MNIIYTDFTLKHNSLDIYVAGCSGNPHCIDCQNPETWDFNIGTNYNKKYYDYLRNRIRDFDSLIKNIMIFGGEPLDQDIDKLIHMLMDFKSFNKKVWLFTRYALENIPKEILLLCNFIKSGKYIPELKTENNIQYGIQLATSNQIIYKKGLDY